MRLFQVRKPWIWRSWQNVYTTTWPILWYPDQPATGATLRHEEIHAKQQLCWLLIPFFLLYLLALPVFFNPFRYRWEWAAYKEGSGYGDETIKRILSGSLYGWLPYWLNGWALYIPPRRK